MWISGESTGARRNPTEAPGLSTGSIIHRSFTRSFGCPTLSKRSVSIGSILRHTRGQIYFFAAEPAAQLQYSGGSTPLSSGTSGRGRSAGPVAGGRRRCAPRAVPDRYPLTPRSSRTHAHESYHSSQEKY